MSQLYRKLLRRLLALSLFGLLPLSTMATHIVGGEIELLHRGQNASTSHRINLNLYFDLNNGNAGAVDNRVVVGVFRKRDNAFLTEVILQLANVSDVDYTIPNCAVAAVRTRLYRYSVDVTLRAEAFADPGGYYISWERCCRNNVISNIQLPGSAASAFYLEFPPLLVNGQPFTNSSPVFNVVKGDYACINRPFTFDFGARDADGDSLVYSMVTPLNGTSNANNPRPSDPTDLSFAPTFRAGPYSEIRWLGGYSASSAITGTVPLQVDRRTGQLSVTPDRQGLFVFSVEVLEYRRGAIIGRVRRDYQLTVLDCPVNRPPAVLMRSPTGPGFYRSGTLLEFNDTDKVCFNLLVSDQDPNQVISVLNGSGSLAGLTITPGTINTRNGRDTTTAQFCFDACTLYNGGRAVTIRIQATDNACPQGATTTLDVLVLVRATPTIAPVATTDLRNSQATVTTGSSLSFNAIARDPQSSTVTLQAVGRGFTLASAGMSFTPASGTAVVQRPFAWQPTCAQATRGGEYVVDFIAIKRACGIERRDTTTVRLTTQGPPNEPPSIHTSLPNRVVELTIVPDNPAAGNVQFTVFGNDPDRTDSLRLTGAGRGFTFQQAGMTFANKNGRPELQSPFSWQATCDILQGRREATYILDFANSDGSCTPKNRDTTSVVVRLKTPDVNYDDLKVPNTFTPNNDGKNDYFALINVPVANCYERFERVEIYNRWGVRVFLSNDKAFRWGDPDYPPGVYYYTVVFGTRQVKGTLMLVR